MRASMSIGELTLDEFRKQGSEFNRFILQMEGIDSFCSSWPWGLAAWESFHPENTPFFHRLADGYLAMTRTIWPNWGRIWLPLEVSWCLACPLVGSEPRDLAHDFLKLLLTRSDWETVLISGSQQGSPLWNQLVTAIGPRFPMFTGPSVTRRIASLTGGLEGFLSRRSSKFRNNLQRALRQVDREQIRFETIGGVLDEGQRQRLFQKILGIERASWKGQVGHGIDEGPMKLFYQRLLDYLGPSGQYQIIFAYKDETPVGYIFGGLLKDQYRGFQFSFDQGYARLSLGNILQLKMIESLCQLGITCYDLGTDIEYKRHWAEQTLETSLLILKK